MPVIKENSVVIQDVPLISLPIYFLIADGPFKVTENNLGNFKGSNMFNDTDACKCFKFLDFKRSFIHF
jgi:hypothetical protein